MDNPRVQMMIRPFDPLSHEAEDQYDAVVRRVNRVRARRKTVTKKLLALEREFLDGDLEIRSGPRAGEPLPRKARKRKLDRMLELGAEARQLAAEEQFSVAALDRMNEALDRWARETYSP